jgi:hypothetical protein
MPSYAGKPGPLGSYGAPSARERAEACDQLGYSISTAQQALEGLRKAGLVRPKMHRAGKILVEHWYRTEDLLQRPKHCWELTEDDWAPDEDWAP